ncbi:MAG: PAS domain S-box protein [Desulfosporosinus sp.]|nr:PAS domain S-box protein [Desulfosporosinus sp.]
MDTGTTELDFNTLKKILDNSHDEIYVTNAMGIVIYVNNVCEKHYGVKASEIIGKNLVRYPKRNTGVRGLVPLQLIKK